MKSIKYSVWVLFLMLVLQTQAMADPGESETSLNETENFFEDEMLIAKLDRGEQDYDEDEMDVEEKKDGEDDDDEEDGDDEEEEEYDNDEEDEMEVMYDSFIELIKTEATELYAQWKILEARRENEAMELFEHAGLELLELKQNESADFFKLKCNSLGKQLKVANLVHTYHRTQSADRNNIKTKIEAELSELFDLKIQIREKEIERLKQELKELQQSTSRAKQNKDKHVRDHLAEITGQGEKPFDW